MQLCLLVWLLSLYKQAYRKVLSIVVRPLFLGIVLPIIIFVAMFNLMVPFPAADKLYPELWSYGLYGSIFLVGAGFYHHHELLAGYLKRINVLFLLAVASTIVYFVVLPADLTIEQVIEAANAGGVVKLEHTNIVALASQTIAIVTWTAVALLAGFKWLNQRNEFSVYMSNASYWLYLIHLPLLMYIQLPMINISLPAGIKLIILVSAMVIVGVASYHLLVRNTLIGVFLNDKRQKPKQVLAQTSQNNT